MNAVMATIILVIINNALAAPIYSQVLPTATTITVADRDTELREIKNRMRDIRGVLAAIPRTAAEPGLSAQVLEANKALQVAERNFKAGNWKVAISEAKRFFDLIQKPDHTTWLRAQFILGRSLEETGQNRNAAKIYLNYLATLSTSAEQPPEELTDVFGRLVRLATKNTSAPHSELSKFLSSIVAINRPPEISDKMKYLSGVASSNIKKRDIAISWLEETDSEAASPVTKASAKYFRALLAIHDQKWPKASKKLGEIVKLEGISESSRDTARLALARVLIKEKKPNLALEMYDKVSETSDSHRDANFEKIFLLIQEDRNEEAQKASQQWLSKYSVHQDAEQIRALTSWLDIKTGNLNGAKVGIEKTQQLLTNIRNELNRFRGPKFTKNDVERLEALTQGHVSKVKTLDEIRDTFNQLDNLRERLVEVDGIERGLIFALAKSDLQQFKPALANQLIQYDLIADEVLQAGAKLIYFDQTRLEKQLADLDRQKLETNRNRRAVLFDKYAQLKRQWRRWQTWASSAEQLAKLAKEWERLDVIAGKTAATTIVSVKESEASGLHERISSIRMEILNTLRSLQAFRSENLVEQSDFADSLEIFAAYNELLCEDMDLLAAYAPSKTSTSEKLDDSDARHARAEWRFTSDTLKLNMAHLNARAHDDISTILGTLTKSNALKSQLMSNVDQLLSALESYAGDRLPFIISQFDFAIGQRMGKQLKWAGDIEYLKYAESTNAQDAAHRKYELEKQILSDEMRDYGQRRTR